MVSYYTGRRLCILILVGFTAYIMCLFFINRLAHSIILSSSRVKSNPKNLDLCQPDFWRTVNLLEKDVPSDVYSGVNRIKVKSNFTYVEKARIHYLYGESEEPKNVSVLLLHGQAYSANVWSKIKTIQNLTAFGYYTVAIDLPGFGQSKPPHVRNKQKLLLSLIKALNLKNPVIVSPSMSGVYSIKFIMQYSHLIAGFVPVAPVATAYLDKSPCNVMHHTGVSLPFDEDCQSVQKTLNSNVPLLDCIKVPTMVVFGEKDAGENSARLCHLPNSHGEKIPNAEHAAYLSDPVLWHKLLYNFLDILSKTLSCVR